MLRQLFCEHFDLLHLLWRGEKKTQTCLQGPCIDSAMLRVSSLRCVAPCVVDEDSMVMFTRGCVFVVVGIVTAPGKHTGKVKASCWRGRGGEAQSHKPEPRHKVSPLFFFFFFSSFFLPLFEAFNRDTS